MSKEPKGQVGKRVSINIPEGLERLAKESGHSVESILTAFADTIIWSPPAAHWLKKAKEPREAFSRLLEGAELGMHIIDKIVETLKLDGFMLMDCGIELDEAKIWVHFEATTAAKVSVHSVSIWIERGLASAVYGRYLDELDEPAKSKLRKLVERFNNNTDSFPFYNSELNYELDFDEEDSSLGLWVVPESLGEPSLVDLPDVPLVSRFFERLEKGCRRGIPKSKFS